MQAKERNISPIKQRILFFAGTLGISKRDFYSKIGVSRGTLESKTGITEEVITKFFAAYPEVRTEWLMFGTGNMLKDNNSSHKEPVDIIPPIPSEESDAAKRIGRTAIGYSKKQFLPRIPLDAEAGYLSGITEGIALPDCEMLPVIQAFPQYDFTIFARGDSMSPNILSGDELACRFINEKSFIQWGRIHVIDTAQGVVVKRLFEKDDKIIGRSINREYPDCIIDKADVFRLALVVGLIRQL